MKNRCFNCKYFISCKREDKDPKKKDCEYFQKISLMEVQSERDISKDNI